MEQRGRPRKYRMVRVNPKISQFSPRGKPGRPDEIIVTVDEYEAIRLGDHMGIGQKEAAKSMHISQQTFSRLLRRAHKGLATALVNGAIIKIQGGTYVVSSREEAPKIESAIK